MAVGRRGHVLRQAAHRQCQVRARHRRDVQQCSHCLRVQRRVLAQQLVLASLGRVGSRRQRHLVGLGVLHVELLQQPANVARQGDLEGARLEVALNLDV